MDDQNREGRLVSGETQTSSTSQAAQAAERTVTTEQVRDLRRVVDTLRLHEERALVEVVPESLGAITVRRVLTQREEVVPITLGREHLEITVTEGKGGRVTMNGEVLEVGRTYEVPLYEERAVIERQAYPYSDVVIAKQRETYEQVERLTLRREELEVEDPQGLVRDRLMPDSLDPQP
ncbi:YsnF/AvaK domain-containing protein [Deinococcus planocerae]|uniref:YsnF/AvaK domain-containing protein n=1 Tax=Deinococcus planocerae TaxID=1737569 RepID=UPI000C7EFA80|nr:YsnF/AvaK domain-containing protein [Deinococcus planocerae]